MNEQDKPQQPIDNQHKAEEQDSFQSRSRIEEQAQNISQDDIEVVKRKSLKLEQLAHKGPLARFREDILLLIDLIKDYARGDYREVPWWSIAAVTTTLLYVLNPFDLIHDLIPLVGLGDDAVFIASCLKMIETDLHHYREWRNQQALTADSNSSPSAQTELNFDKAIDQQQDPI